MGNIYLVITSIADQEHSILLQFAQEARKHGVGFILVGDTKSPKDFHIEGCDFYSIDRQKQLSLGLAKLLPERHYARKNIGYLQAMKNGADVIIETDDDNSPMPAFWASRNLEENACVITGKDWINAYKYFTDMNIWPRGYPLDKIMDSPPPLGEVAEINCPIQQGLADENPDVDAVYRLTLPLPVTFEQKENIAIGEGAWCPFNSQNTTWFKDAFPLLYLPSYCSFRMTDIWRSFVAQRIAWTCGWKILFHNATVRQERNDHDLITDFKDEIPGYLNNYKICGLIQDLDLKSGKENIYDNMFCCYDIFINNGLIDKKERQLLEMWFEDCQKIF